LVEHLVEGQVARVDAAAQRELKDALRGRQRTRRDDLDRVQIHVLARHDDRPVALAEGRSVRQEQIAVRDGRIRAGGERRHLEAAHGRVTIGALAKDLGVSPASASAMVKKLSALDLLTHERYQGAHLTEAGEKVAVEVIRHHRLLELYLAKTLGVHVDDVHAEADRLEHVISEELEARIDRALGFPTHDPHGDPIPDANLNWP